MVIHESSLEAVQVHPTGPVTATLPVVALAEIERDVADRLKVHGAPACVNVKVSPAMVIEPTREVALVFAATE